MTERMIHEATALDLAAEDWRSHGPHVFRGEYADEPDVWVTVECAESPDIIAAHIAEALNAHGRGIRRLCEEGETNDG